MWRTGQRSVRGRAVHVETAGRRLVDSLGLGQSQAGDRSVRAVASRRT